MAVTEGAPTGSGSESHELMLRIQAAQQHHLNEYSKGYEQLTPVSGLCIGPIVKYEPVKVDYRPPEAQNIQAVERPDANTYVVKQEKSVPFYKGFLGRILQRIPKFPVSS